MVLQNRAMKTRATVLAILLFGTAAANAHFIDLGQINLTGTFTLNHLYDFNNPGAQPFGSFGTMTAQNVSGIFLDWTHGGDALGFSNGPSLRSVAPFPTWTLGGLTFSTTFVLITGADFTGRNCFGLMEIAAQGFDPPPNSTATWNFIAPPYDISHFDHDITGPITLTFIFGYENGQVADSGSTLLMFGLAASILAYTRKGLTRQQR
jgi:hypothetical protein